MVGCVRPNVVLERWWRCPGTRLQRLGSASLFRCSVFSTGKQQDAISVEQKRVQRVVWRNSRRYSWSNTVKNLVTICNNGGSFQEVFTCCPYCAAIRLVLLKRCISSVICHVMRHQGSIFDIFGSFCNQHSQPAPISWKGWPGGNKKIRKL